MEKSEKIARPYVTALLVRFSYSTGKYSTVDPESVSYFKDMDSAVNSAKSLFKYRDGLPVVALIPDATTPVWNAEIVWTGAERDLYIGQTPLDLLFRPLLGIDKWLERPKDEMR